MRGLTRNVCLSLALVLLVSAVGCQEPETGMSVQDQAAQDAAARIADLERQLAQSRADRSADQERMLALQNELERLRDQLAQAQPGEGWTSVPGGAMIELEGTVLFDSGKADLRPAGRQALDDVAAAIQSRFAAGHDIYIFGHTDNEPIRVSGWKDNYELSCQRALSVLRYLRSRGVSAGICAGGWGEDRPEVSNASVTARQANRRVQIFAMAQRQ